MAAGLLASRPRWRNPIGGPSPVPGGCPVVSTVVLAELTSGVGRRARLDLAYWLLASISIGLIPLGPFPGLALVRMAPTVVLAFGAFPATQSAFGATIACGLLAGAMGDYFLNTFDPDLAVYGVLAFLIGHVFYIAGLRRAGWSASAARRSLVSGLATFGLGYGAVIAWVNPLQPVRSIGWVTVDPPRLVPVTPALLAYMPLLIGMASVAVMRRGSRVLALGALVFVASDSIIPLNQFLLPRAHPSDLYATEALLYPGYITYYLAQYLIARGAMAEAAAPASTT